MRLKGDMIEAYNTMRDIDRVNDQCIFNKVMGML